MHVRWQRYKESVEGVSLQSFALGLLGGVLVVTTGNVAWRQQLDVNTNCLRTSLENIKKGYEVKGGVPFLLRDDTFLERLGKCDIHQKSHWLQLIVQNEWNQLVYQLAAVLNQYCTKKYFTIDRQ